MARRTCDRCGALMPPHYPRKRLADQQVCEGCYQWGSRTAALDYSQRAVDQELPEEVHRGLALRLPAELHEQVHDQDRPVAERAQLLSDHLKSQGYNGRVGLGPHWTTNEGTASGYSKKYKGWPEASPYDFEPDERATRVVLHAKAPKPSQMLSNERTLRSREIFGHEHSEKEVPVRRNAVMHLTGISFGPNVRGGELARHDFDEPIRHKAALHNPTGELRGAHPEEWYHGSKNDFEEFHDPMETSPLAYSHDPDDDSHWNTLLGNHFSSQHQIAEKFAGGGHQGRGGGDDDDEDSAEHLIHAKLHIKRPKTYRSEHEMDQEAYEHERAQGNHIDNHLSGDPDQDEDDYPLASRYAGDSGHHYTINDQDHGAYGYHSHFHPVATGWLNSHPDKLDIAARFKKRLQQQGYDGIVYGNEFEQDAWDKGNKNPDAYTHPPLDMPEVGEHNRKVPQHSITAIPFDTKQIEITQHHYGRGHKSPQELEDERRSDVLPLVHTPYRQPYLPGMDDLRHEAAKYTTYYHGTSIEPRENPEDEWGASHVLPAGTHMHSDPEKAWGHALKHWHENYGYPAEFPRVYQVHLPDTHSHEHTPGGGIVLSHPQGVREEEYLHYKHPAIRRPGEPKDILYHGTAYDDDLEDIQPGARSATHGPGTADPSYAYATKSPHSAWQYAEDRAERHGGTPTVYRVTPHKPKDLEEDPYYSGGNNRGTREGDMRSKSGFQVLDQVPPTRKQQREMEPEEEHWDDEDEDGGWEHEASRRTAAWTMKYITYGPEGYIDKERQIEGPLYHGSRSKSLDTGDLITPKRKPNPWGDEGPKSTHVYFTDRPEVAQDYADQAGGYVYEVEPTGEIKPDYQGSDYKSPHPLRVLRRHQPGRTASTAEEYAKQDAGRQDVWQVQTEGKIQPLCDYHCQAALGRDRAANSLGAYYDLGQEPSGRLSGPEKGSCAHCGRDTDYVLKGLNRGNSRFDYHDSQQPRTRRTGPYMPTKTKPFTPVKQSESSKEEPWRDLFPTAYGPEGTEPEIYGTGIKRVRHSKDMPNPLYHGTSHEFQPGDMIEPGHPGNFVRRMKHVYATESAEEAKGYGWHGASRENGRIPRVYEVRPTGPYGHRSDAKGENWASEHPWEVVREVWNRPWEEKKEAMRKQAHDATENQDLRHCPFCGSGKIIGRADGSVECEFCHNYFTVQVQPQYPNFPQTINGQGTPPPGMPGQVEQPSVEGGAPGDEEGGFPPGDEDEEGIPSDLDEGGDDVTEEDSAAEDSAPPFAKKSFRTVTGARLNEDQYVRHLAIRLASDSAAMAAQIKAERK